MSAFPYFEIAKQAYELTVKHRWLWVFGLFIGGTTGMNFGWFNYLLPPLSFRNLASLEHWWLSAKDWIAAHPADIYYSVFLVLVAGWALIVLAGLSKGAVIWTAARLVKPRSGFDADQPVNFKKSLKAGRRYLWSIIGLRIVITIAFLAMLVVFVGPTVYLFALNAVGKAVALGLLGMLFFLPAMVVFGFLHIYGPIFLVLYQTSIAEALQYGFNLVRQKFKESLILAAFLVGLSVLFVFFLLFSTLLVILPFTLFVLLLLKLGLITGAYVLILGAGLAAICYTVVLGAGFAVFQNIAWTLAVIYLVKTQKLGQEAQALATAEPA